MNEIKALDYGLDQLLFSLKDNKYYNDYKKRLLYDFNTYSSNLQEGGLMSMFDADKDYGYEELVRLAKKKQAGPEGGSTYALLAVADRLNEILKILQKR